MHQSGPTFDSVNRFAIGTVVVGAVSFVATTSTIMACGQFELGNAAQPLNAISHILWGDSAATFQSVSLKYTGAGLFLHMLAMVMWSGFYTIVFDPLIRRGGGTGLSILAGIAVSAIAYITDYFLVPARLTPGFEKVLSNHCLFGVFASLAAGLAVGYLISGQRMRRVAAS